MTAIGAIIAGSAMVAWWLLRDPTAGRILPPPSGPPSGRWVAIGPAASAPGGSAAARIGRVAFTGRDLAVSGPNGEPWPSRVVPEAAASPGRLRFDVMLPGGAWVRVTACQPAPDLLLLSDNAGSRSLAPEP